MRGIHLIFFIVICSLIVACGNLSEEISIQSGLLISNVTIISPDSSGILPENGYVVTDGERIVYAGSERPVLSGEYREIDGTGKFLIPGLIDSHVHVTEVQGMIGDHMRAHPELVSQFQRQMPRSYLYYGFTTLINLGGLPKETEADFNALPLHPDLFHTGRSGAPVANGYPMNFAPPEFRFREASNFIYLESEADRIPDEYSPADHSPEAVVKRISESGAIAVKAYYETGFRNMPRLPVPDMEIMEALKEHSHEKGLVLTVHGNAFNAHDFLSRAGVDVIAHGLWNWGEYSESDTLPAEIIEVLDREIDRQIGYTPTLTVLEGERVLADSLFLENAELEEVLPAGMIEWYKSDEGQWFKQEIFGDFPADEVNRIYGGIQKHGNMVLKYLSENGGLILFGTDTPSAPTYGNPPGYNGFIELRMMQEAGVSLETILRSATINNANAFHLENDYGTIATGKLANMLLLEENPLETIEAYDRIHTVILRGKAVPRGDLSNP